MSNRPNLPFCLGCRTTDLESGLLAAGQSAGQAMIACYHTIVVVAMWPTPIYLVRPNHGLAQVLGREPGSADYRSALGQLQMSHPEFRAEEVVPFRPDEWLVIFKPA